MQLTSRNKPKQDSLLPPSSDGSSSLRDEESSMHLGQEHTNTPKNYHAHKHSSSTPTLLTFLRKAFSSPISSNSTTQNSNSSNVLKDIIWGAFLGILFVIFLIFLDYKNIIYLGSARAFRTAAFEMVTEPQTIKYVEESLGWKFISMDIYNAITEEMKDIQKQIEERHAEIEENGKKLEKCRLEAPVVKKEHDEIMARMTVLFPELNKFCGECKWYGPTSCEERMNYLMQTYGNKEWETKLDLMKATPNCMKG
mmetsp:Transcript_11268/g.23724  ORF Transcript_11268/g.23724 Transcript_11268/m.23724 type:complete len:253 (-) Transcript_11268:270-1028(-)